MGLVIPGVGTELGPTWASDLNASLAIIDQHDHTTGQGVPIPPAGLDINSDLTMQGNNLTSVNTVRFVSLGAEIPGTAPNLGCLYVAGNELVYNDEAGNIVPITKTGSVNAGAGSITGLPFGTASASYVAANQTFVWQSATNTPANLNAASITLRNLTANSFGLTVNPPSAMAADYSITEPPPNNTGGTVVLTYDTSNNIGLGPSTSSSFLPTGAFIPYGGTSAPTGYLLCDGSAVSRTTYSALFGVIGTAYGAGDGTTTFNVPPMGVFFRNVDTTGTYDPDYLSRSAINGGNATGVGSLQAFQIQSHSHVLPGGANGALGGTLTPPFQTPVANSASTLATGGNQTNPVNVYANYIIKT